MISALREVLLDERDTGGLEVIDCNGAAHRVTLREPLGVT